MTDNVQKLYKIAGVEKKPVYSGSQLYNPVITGYKYPPFTAEKQLELIKWLSQNFNIVRFWTEYFQYIAEIDGVLDVDKEFDQALVGLILGLWKDLSDDQKQEIKRILQ